jgi:hypothetical protein
MNDEPNSRNHHKEELEADMSLPPESPELPELAALTARLTSDGARWQSRLPDPAHVAEHIRDIAQESPRAASEEAPVMAVDLTSRPEGDRRAPRPDHRHRAPAGPGGRFLGLIAAVVVVALLATLFLRLANPGRATGPGTLPTPTQTQPAPTPTTPPATATSTPTTYPVLVYFSKHPDSLNDPTAVFPVQRVAPTSAVATFAIQQLVAGPTVEERSAGLFSELNSIFIAPSECDAGSNPTQGGPDFTLTLNKKGSTTEQGTATLQFCRPTSSPGIGADARIKAEIDKTLTQFSTITKVVILTRSGHCFGDESGLDLCLK